MRVAKAIILFTIVSAACAALEQSVGADAGASDAAKPPANAVLLPDKLGTVRSTGELKSASPDAFDQPGSNNAAFLEYRLSRASSRPYAALTVDAFETESTLTAFGLFTYLSSDAPKLEQDLGYRAAPARDGLVVWKDKYVIRVRYSDNRPVQEVTRAMTSLARSAAELIDPASGPKLPTIVDSLPAQGRISGTEHYFLGPEALNPYAAHAKEMFEFHGDAEAVIAEYDVGVSNNTNGADLNTPPAKAPARVKLLIVEYHTPQFATDSMVRVSEFVDSLSPDEQQRIIVKREGNYIVEALDVTDREAAQLLVDSVQYNYAVKWLRNPLLPTNDPFRQQKAAEMLLSTFGILGLMIVGVLAGGGIFGTTIFLKRRKRQREVFSDAGGMLRLELDPFVLGLPPKRSDD